MEKASDRLQACARRREALAALSDAQLEERFWQLCHRLVQPMVELARTHTSPSIERAVLLRMGIDSLTAAGVVAKIGEKGMLGRGAGHILLEAASTYMCSLQEAAKRIVEDPRHLDKLLPAAPAKK